MIFRPRNKHASKLTAELVYSARRRYAAREVTQLDLARELGVTINTVRNFLHAVTWQEVPTVEPEAEVSLKAVQSEALMEALLHADLPPDQPEAEPLPPRSDPLDKILRSRGGSDPLRRLTQETRNADADTTLPEPGSNSDSNQGSAGDS